ncbi:hypothetical protein QQ045_011496 [Rhodiola kirilowii]
MMVLRLRRTRGYYYSTEGEPERYGNGGPDSWPVTVTYDRFAESCWISSYSYSYSGIRFSISEHLQPVQHELAHSRSGYKPEPDSLTDVVNILTQ